MGRFWFTSDPHFKHKNVIQHCKRPFADLYEMERTMLTNWNDRVAEDDTVFLLGDVSFGNKADLTGLRHRLKGKIIVIRGNHDRSVQAMRDCGFDEVYNNYQLELDGWKLYLAHIPIGLKGYVTSRQYKPEFTPKPPAYFDYFVHGHVHEHWAERDNYINVGVDVRGFAPVSQEELLQIIGKIRAKP